MPVMQRVPCNAAGGAVPVVVGAVPAAASARAHCCERCACSSEHPCLQQQAPMSAAAGTMGHSSIKGTCGGTAWQLQMDQ